MSGWVRAAMARRLSISTWARICHGWRRRLRRSPRRRRRCSRHRSHLSRNDSRRVSVVSGMSPSLSCHAGGTARARAVKSTMGSLVRTSGGAIRPDGSAAQPAAVTIQRWPSGSVNVAAWPQGCGPGSAVTAAPAARARSTISATSSSRSTVMPSRHSLVVGSAAFVPRHPAEAPHRDKHEVGRVVYHEHEGLGHAVVGQFAHGFEAQPVPVEGVGPDAVVGGQTDEERCDRHVRDDGPDGADSAASRPG